MGQKIHPVGFRLNITQNHRSVWFTKLKNYAELLEQDFKIRNFINKKFGNSGITLIEIERTYKSDSIFLKIYAAKPANILDNGELGVIDLRHKLKKNFDPKIRINIDLFQVLYPNRSAILLAQSISDQLRRRVAFKRTMRKTIKQALVNNIKGIKIQISGRLNGAEIARSEWSKEGRMPLQTLRADIDYAHVYAKTIYGILGIKVWLFKGETILKKK